MNKSQLIDAISAAADLPKTVASRCLDATIEAVTKALVQDDKVTIPGLGIFGVKLRAARTGRNPQTGNAIHIPESKVSYFKAGKALKDAIQLPVEEAIAVEA